MRVALVRAGLVRVGARSHGVVSHVFFGVVSHRIDSIDDASLTWRDEDVELPVVTHATVVFQP